MSMGLVLNGIRIPPKVLKSGHCAAYISSIEGAIDPDLPTCHGCYKSVDFYVEQCRCGARKPWLYRDELVADDFDDL